MRCVLQVITRRPIGFRLRTAAAIAWALTSLSFAYLIPSLFAHQLAGALDEFAALTQHVEHALGMEKRRFHEATACTEWYYKRQSRKPRSPAVEPISWISPVPTDAPVSLSPAEDCPRLYPKGLEEARRAFSHSQASLSLGLTFYELALVADRDDDRTYSSAELGDLLDAMILPSVAAQLDAASALKSKFDLWLKDRNLEQIMIGMGRLYDHGYRLTAADRAALDRVMR